MKNHEKQSLIKFTLIYFFSIALLIILLGFLYFIQQKELILKKTTTEMFQYSQLVVKTDFKYTQNGFSYELKKNQKVAFEFPRKENDYYIKAFPISKQNGYIVVKTVSKSTDEEIKNLKIFTISLQIILLILLLIVSYYLAKKSLEPMKETISHLDRFILFSFFIFPSLSSLFKSKLALSPIAVAGVFKSWIKSIINLSKWEIVSFIGSKDFFAR